MARRRKLGEFPFDVPRQPVRGRVRHARTMARGMKASRVGPLKMLGYLLGDRREQRKTDKAYRKRAGRKAYKAMMRDRKKTNRYYRMKDYQY